MQVSLERTRLRGSMHLDVNVKQVVIAGSVDGRGCKGAITGNTFNLSYGRFGENHEAMRPFCARRDRTAPQIFDESMQDRTTLDPKIHNGDRQSTISPRDLDLVRSYARWRTGPPPFPPKCFTDGNVTSPILIRKSRAPFRNFHVN